MKSKYEAAHEAILRKAAQIANSSPDRPLRLMVAEPFLEASNKTAGGLGLEVERHAWEFCDAQDKELLARIATEAIYDAITSDETLEFDGQNFTYRTLFAALIVEAAREGDIYFERFRNPYAESDQGTLLD